MLKEIEWVEIPGGLLVARHLVTQFQWENYGKENNSVQLGNALPVHNVSIRTLQNVCKTSGWRFPTADEWATFALAGLQISDYMPLSDYAVTGTNRLPMVGTKKPNAWGLYDCFGMLWEPVTVPGESGVKYCGQCYNMPVDKPTTSCYTGMRIEPRVVGFRPVKDSPKGKTKGTKR
jgi:formylglycine-generating enzyme required for sulfatase activity